MISLDYIKRFQQISYYFNQQAYSQLVSMFKTQLSIATVPVEIATMYAIALRRLHQYEDSRAAFLAAVKISPQNAPLRNAYGNLLVEIGDFEQALAQFKHVISLAPANTDGHINSARALNLLKRFDEAVVSARKAYLLSAKNANVRLVLAESLANAEELVEAQQLYEMLLVERPDNLKVLNNLGNLKRRLGLVREAISLFQRAAGSANPIVLRNLAACYVLDRQFEQAGACYIKAMSSDDVLAYTDYLSLLWQRGDAEPFRYIEQRLTVSPTNYALAAEFIKILLQAEMPDKAEPYLLSLLEHYPADVTILTLAIMVYRAKDELERAVEYGQRALKTTAGVSNIGVRSELAYTYLALYQGEAARDLYQNLCQDDPFNQGWWTTLGTALKLCGDEKQYNWLCDYKLVNVSRLCGPDSKALLPADFNRELLQRLNELHTNIRAPLGLSLRKGSQTFENLFDKKDAILTQLRIAIECQAREFINSLRHDPNHPFLSRLSTEFNFQGSWSVRLTDEGFHKSHFHPMGWLSGVYYVDIPDAVDYDGQGWLVLGRPDIPHHDYYGDYAVKPASGMLVLFPSFMWHGTNPFKANSHRVTVAFDIIPKVSRLN